MVRILVVDDNPAVRHYLRAILEQQSSWQVCDEARTGSEALERVQKAPPDLILLDFQMPDLNGLDVAQQISHLFPKIPILMVTIHLSRQLAEAAQNVGIRGACAKTDVGSIVEAVDALLHQRTYFPTISAAAL
ncbi:MAG: response regulator transcription factor [Acidobacteriia bacterium]|nr:response regulator transcription factor [Terriglobia bacterium]